MGQAVFQAPKKEPGEKKQTNIAAPKKFHSSVRRCTREKISKYTMKVLDGDQ